MKISLEFESVREMREFYEGVQFVPYGEIRNKKPKEPPEKTSATEPKKTEESTEKALKIRIYGAMLPGSNPVASRRLRCREVA